MARNSSKKSDSGVDPVDIPVSLMEDRISVGTKAAVVTGFANQIGLDMESTLHFLEGLESYHEDMEHEQSGYFGLTIEDVTLEEINVGNNFVLGKKARIHYRSKGYKSEKIEDQTIDTEWVEFYGNNPEIHVFSVSVATKLYEMAQELVGKKVFIRKHIIENDKGKYRYLAYIREDFSNKDDDDDDNSSSSSRRRGASSGRRGSKGSSWKESVDEALDNLDKKDRKEITSDDLTDLFYKLDGQDADGIKESMVDYLEISKKDLAKVKPGSDLAKFAVELFLESLPED